MKGSKTNDGVKLLAALTNASEEEVLKHWDKAKENTTRLLACPGHLFGPPSASSGGRQKCSICGGLADAREVKLYEQGKRHGAQTK